LIHFDKVLPTDATLKIERQSAVEMREDLNGKDTLVADEGKGSFCVLF
jgi:hypothetical protein